MQNTVISAVATNERPTADGYHNQAVRASRTSGFEEAFEVVTQGLEVYPNDIDLLADALCYSGKNNATVYFRRLMKLDRRRFTWRAFDFSIDFLVDALVPQSDDPSTVGEFFAKALALSEEFIKYFPYDERSYSAKVKVLQKRNDENDSEMVEKIFREQVIENHTGIETENAYPVPALSMRYADWLLERGRYHEVVQAVRIGLAGSAQDQPSVRIGYLCYLKALAEDALIHLDSLGTAGDVVFLDNKRVDSILRDYKVARRLLAGTDYIGNINNRTTILRIMAGLGESDATEEKDSSTEMLDFLRRLRESSETD